MNSNDVLDFWFEELQPTDWWKKSAELDTTIEKRFGELHQQARQGELFTWRDKPKSSLAEIIVLDQFSRNIFRDSAKSFAQDPQALTLSQLAIDKTFDQKLTQVERQFMYMPFMHSESTVIHEQAVKLYSALENGYGHEFELKHKVIIDRFGRYPHRNQVLNRESTEEEQEFLKQPGSSF